VDKILEALERLLRICIEFFGPNVTLALIFLVPFGLFAFRFYTDWRKRQEVNEALKAKDETIQTLAELIRQYRVIELRQQGWSEEAIERIVLRNTPKDAIEARKLLEDGGEVRSNRRKREDEFEPS